MSRSEEFLSNLKLGTVVLIGQDTWIRHMIRDGQESVTSNHKRSRWANVFLYLHALGLHLSDQEVDTSLATAQKKVEGGEPYPIVELLGTLWAYMTRTLLRRNPFDLKESSYCSAFVNDCFGPVKRIVSTSIADPTNVSPEHVFQSEVRSPERKGLYL